MSKLIHISEAASLAIHSVALIAASNEPLNASQIAKTLTVSRNHMAKVLQVLVHHNYLTSIRGPKGGFMLKRSSEDITLLEILELIEGDAEITYCNVHDSNCPFHECVYGDIREKVTNDLINFFNNRKISDLILKNNLQ